MIPEWEGLAGFVDAALQHKIEPGQGIWEVRGDPKHFTASKVMCWVAAARGGDLAAERGDDKRARRWRAGAEEIKAEVLDKAFPAAACSGSSTRLSLSVPRCCCRSWFPPARRRAGQIDRACHRRRADKGGLVLRPRVESTDTGFEGAGGTFTICSFLLVTALA